MDVKLGLRLCQSISRLKKKSSSFMRVSFFLGFKKYSEFLLYKNNLDL